MKMLFLEKSQASSYDQLYILRKSIRFMKRRNVKTKK